MDKKEAKKKRSELQELLKTKKVKSTRYNIEREIGDLNEIINAEPQERDTIEEANLFHTPKSTAEIHEYINGLCKEERVIASVIFGMTWNLCAYLTRDKTKD